MLRPVIFRGKNKRFYAHLIASNGRIVWRVSEGDGYARRKSVEDAIELLKHIDFGIENPCSTKMSSCEGSENTLRHDEASNLPA